jgi:putative membrane protein
MAEPEVADATRRTRLANERTYMAWMRTGLTSLAVAIGAGKIVPSVAHASRLPFELLGAGFALLGVAVTVYGARRYLEVDEALKAGRFASLGGVGAIALAAAVGALGLATLVLVFVR